MHLASAFDAVWSWAFRMNTHSVESRFILIVSSALLLLIAPLFALFFYLSNERAYRDVIDHGQVLLKANSLALGKPLWDFDEESVRQIAGTILADRSVVSVRVHEVAGGLDVRLPERTRDKDAPGEILSTPVHYRSVDGTKTVGSLEIALRQRDLRSDFEFDDAVYIGIFLFAIVIITAAAILGNRLMVTRPLLRLTHAIEATRRLGSRHVVDWVSADEMGMLAANFNEMQARLAQEENDLKRAHQKTTRLYNLTPAKLYSIDDDDRLTAVSDYWLLATGYDRQTVIGRPFADFLDPATRRAYENRKRQASEDVEGATVTVKFRCADGRLIDVLIKEAQAFEADETLSLAVMTDVTELKTAEQRNHVQAITDHLTGLLNRPGFETALDAAIQQTAADGGELACLLIDLDRFKPINDNLGHAAGDEVLRQIAGRIRAQVRGQDKVGRLGGDEFVVLIPAAKAENAALQISERIAAACSEPVVVDGNSLSLSASIGIALYPAQARSAAELLQKSDMAMYARKHNGKNGAKLFDPLIASLAQDRLKIDTYIEDGLRQDWFDVHLQPIVDLKLGKVAGFEALMRLNHPEHGVLPPADIIRVAEETGAILKIGERIFEKAVAHLARLSCVPGLENAYLAVNFSPLQFCPKLPAATAATLMQWGIPPSRIVIEITEAVLMHHSPDIRDVLGALSGAGMKIALDDFGTGYSSLSYLVHFPVSIIKIDQAFTRSLTDDSETVRRRVRKLIAGIQMVAKELNCQVVAEGIETDEQLSTLLSMEVNCGQGYFLGRPQPVTDILSGLQIEHRPLLAVPGT
ncbi:PAS domain S-box-containing protein/diguanylate cyclase (GGDEF)-like protein [Sinorhizobium americanum]|uniref:PAS domain S-box-containing protein/diguanylate cyclase (GGDEF)-like protein n=2 Tax=Sinorhizobium americanum TaxID=194963 RepID=A0A4R2C3C6_9HYPH|nr:PAS domain S-box-containing protein/diguanylate cyclase (GGDEF)-like protein [Sinorhizobium americanum]